MKDRARRSNFNYVAVVGAAFLILIVLALVNLLRTEDSGTVGIGEVSRQAGPQVRGSGCCIWIRRREHRPRQGLRR